MFETRLELIYGILSAIVAAIDIVLAEHAFRKGTRTGRYLGLTMLATVMVDVFYFFSIVTPGYFAASLMSSLYFGFVDVMTFFMLLYAVNFTEMKRSRGLNTVLMVLFFYMIFDWIVLLINPFKEIAITYISRGTSFAFYEYGMKPLYVGHLIFAYIQIALALMVLIIGTLRVPKDYRRQYSYSLLIIVLVIAVNALFLFWPMPALFELIDYSIMLYSVASTLLYWNTFQFRKNGMLKQFQGMIIENVDQAVILFAYDDKFLYANKKLCGMFPQINWNENLKMQDFLRESGLDAIEKGKGLKMSYQCFVGEEDQKRPVRFDYRPLYGARGNRTGSLFVITDVAYETDILTGFHNWKDFTRRVKEEDKFYGYPLTAAVCDINGLARINQAFGRETGDQAIQSLAQLLRAKMPQGSYFIRGKEAYLMCLVYSTKASWVQNCLEEIRKEYSWDMQYGIVRVESSDEDLLACIGDAIEGMQAKKMLDATSAHSSMLTSLVQALQECDADTEAHVKRTQHMGALFGERFGLTDVQQSQLSLLCIMHDIGKIGIPLEILNKPGRLTDEEFSVLQTHVEKGYQIARSSKELEGIADMIRHHHERWDGKGYPDGLAKETTPLLSRVISVIDAYDAMTNDRSYRKKMSRKAAREELRRCAATQFDPAIVAEFLAMLEQEEELDEGEKALQAEELEQAEKARSKAREEKEAATPEYGTYSLEAIYRNQQKLSGSQEEFFRENAVHPLRYSRYILDENSRIIVVDDNFEYFTGYSNSDVVNLKLSQVDLIFPEEQAKYLVSVQNTLNKQTMAYFEHRIRRKDGTPVYVICYGKDYYDSAARASRSEIIITKASASFAVQTMLGEVQARVENRMEFWEQKYRSDPLTGLMTHEAFQSDVEEKLLSDEYRILMMMIDLDRFKDYNDTFGHRAGDEFLIFTASVLSSALRKGDMASRMGGDEFSIALLFPKSVDDSIIHKRANQIFENISMTMSQETEGYGISMGAAISGGEIRTFNQLYEAADRALYRSKRDGRGKISF